MVHYRDYWELNLINIRDDFIKITQRKTEFNVKYIWIRQETLDFSF